MTADRTFVIVGAGLAGAKAAQTLREEGFDGRVVIVGAERERPYERPPLSKDYLRGEAERGTIYVHDEAFYAEHEIELRPGRAATHLDTGVGPYSDVLYVEQLIAPDVITTMPEATLRAFADHGAATHRIGERTGEATLMRAERAGVDLDAITAALEREGISAFCDSYRALLECIEDKLQTPASTATG